MLNNMSFTEMSPDFGFLFQQLALQLLKRRFDSGLANIGYWRTQGQAEVDFVVQEGLKILPVEVKADRMARPQVERSLRSFLDTYQPPNAWVLNRSLKEQISIGATTVHFIPWYELLLPSEI